MDIKLDKEDFEFIQDMVDNPKPNKIAKEVLNRGLIFKKELIDDNTKY